MSLSNVFLIITLVLLGLWLLLPAVYLLTVITAICCFVTALLTLIGK